jgi:hypothetical protein
MLNLSVATTKGDQLRWLFVALLAVAFFTPLRAQAETIIRITAPASGDVLQGLVNITGTSAADGFFASELAFAYASDPAPNWFIIYNTDQPVTDGLLAAWDTNLVTDGDYDLRLRVTLQDGSILETLVTGLRVRNQTPTETALPVSTSTPAPTSTPEFDLPPAPTPLPPTPMPAPTATRQPTPTPLPSNPVAVTPTEIYSFLGRGILLALLAFVVVGILLRLRRS